MLPNNQQNPKGRNQQNHNQQSNSNQWINNNSQQINQSWSQSSISQLSARQSGFSNPHNASHSKSFDPKPIYESRFNLLPRVNDFQKIVKTDGSIPQGKFLTNYYEFNERSIATVYIYQVETLPTIPPDSSDKWYRVIRSIKKKLQKSIGLITFRNNTLWGQFRAHPTEITTVLGGNRFKGPQQNNAYMNQPAEKYQIRYSVTREISMHQLLTNTKQANEKNQTNDKIKPLYTQMINNRIKEKMQELNFVQLGKGRFYWLDNVAKKEGNIKSAGLNVLHGYRFTLTCMNPKKNYVQIDTCSRILRIGNFLEQIQNFQGTGNDKNNYFRGATLLARYGKYKTYTLESIEFNLHPTSTFKANVNGVETDISFATYFQKCYNITITHMQQPMIKAIGKVEKKIEKGNKFTKTPQVIFLIPELLSLTGMSDLQRKNYQVMKDVAEKTKLQPIQRFQMCNKMVQALKKQGTPVQIGNPVAMEGYKLKRPVIKLGKNEQQTDQNGDFAFQQPIIDPFDLKAKEWIMVSSSYTPPKDVEVFYSTMRTAGQVYDIKIDLPFPISVQYTANSNSQMWIDAIKQRISESYPNQKPTIIVLVLQDSEVNLYNDIKRYCCKELKIFTQFFKASTLSSDKKCMSAAGKIILEIAAKVGKKLWTVPPQHPYWKDRFVATASLSYSKGLKNSFTMAMVGTTNNTQTSVYTYCMVGLSKREQVAMQIYANFFEKWLAEYLRCSKKLPDTIIVYRQGLSEAQIKKTVGQEIEQLYHVIEQRIRKNVKGYEQYNPEVVFMTVNKKVNSKFYESGTNENKQRWVKNPSSGSVIFCEMASNGQIDFYLTPMRVPSGAATPCQYRIIYYNAKDQPILQEKKAGGAIPQQTDKKVELPLQALAQFTYEQCFNYYNWQGAVRIPSVMQNADKLSKLAGEHIQTHMNYVDFENSFKQQLMQIANQDERDKRLGNQRAKFQAMICSLYFL